ncbi:MAG: NADH dehydrogenase (ubiquinone) [uncultured bacterium]|nr:MAG: NADH dehydrogenase (ubiquinone) [uncultured bacterium]
MSELEQNNTISDTEIAPAGIFTSLLADKGFIVTPLKCKADNTEIVQIEAEKLLEIATLLKMHKEAQFTLLYSVTGVDHPDRFELVYHLQSVKLNKQVILKTSIVKNNPEIESLASVFATANWHERETYDLLGIKFNNHPDLRRILLPNDWKGHPLRKDYKMDDERLIWNER